MIAGCSSNSTPVSVTITTTTSGATITSLTLLQSTSAQFVATVTGASSNIVFWQICLPSASSTTQPTNCTQGVGPTQCTNIPKVSSPLRGFGTITSNGLYTAPSAPPQPDSFWIVATSCVDTTRFGIFTLIIDSGIRVRVSPASVAIGQTETFQFNVTVTGTANLAVSWQVCQNGANSTPSNCVSNGTVGPNGKISSSGLYTAPATAVSAIVEAISAADQNQTATAAVTVAAQTAPTVTAIDPATAAQGSAQQDVYLTGANFLATTNVIVGGVTLPTANVNVISTTLLRATIPAAQLARAGTIQVGVQDQKGNPPAFASLNVVAVRPAVVSAFPGSVPQSSASSPSVALTGGFFAQSAISATFNGQTIIPAVTSSRQLSLAIPSGSLGTPGLYPIVVKNSGVTAGQPNMAAINLRVTPIAGNIPGSASATTVGVGSNPSAVAIDQADGIAAVANKGDGSVSLISLTSPPGLITTITSVGTQPTGIAVDDLLPHPTALVVNSGDFSVSAIDLTTKTMVGTALKVNIGPPSTSPVPFSIGINPLTHRALVAYQSTNQATILDLSTGAPVMIGQIGGANGSVSFGTGVNPAVAIDPRLNWAVVTPGGSGAASIVDLGMNAGAGLPSGRASRIITAIALTSSSEGIGIDSEAHEGLVSDPQAGTLTTFSLLNFAAKTVTTGAAQFSQKGFGAAAANPLENVGIAVGGSTPGASAVIVNLHDGTVLQNVGGFAGANLQAVAVDPVTNQAVAVDQANNKVYFVSLGPALNPLQIAEASPAVIFGGASATSGVALTINGSGFTNGSQVTLDGLPLSTTFVSSRHLTATVPGGAGGLLGAPRNFALQVTNPGVSNVTDLTVVVPVRVGKAPVGVAVDTDRDLAIVTNSGDGTVSLVTLTPQTPIGPTQTPAGAIQAAGPITVGTTPAGVAEIPRLGLALVANSGSNDLSLIDVTQTSAPVGLCASGCGAGPTGVALNPDSASGVVVNTNITSPTSPGGTTLVTGITKATSTALPTASETTGPPIDHNPVAVAIDTNPLFPYAAAGTNSSASTIDFLDTTAGGSIVGRTSGLSNPTGIVFDPLNQVFLAANSLADEIAIVDPASFLQTPVSVGIGPTSLDYNVQTSTLATVNSISHSMSVLSYVCPPSAGAPACLGPQVSTVIGLGGTQASAPVPGPNAIAVDPILNLAVIVDKDNNQVLLVPLPH
jgi:hypothetical protein